MTNNDSFVTVLTCSQTAEAEVAGTKLESEGIEFFIADKNINSINPLYSVATGGVKVQVRPADLERAKAALGIDDSLLTAQVPSCPKCQSAHVKFKKLPGVLSFFAAVTLGLIFPLKSVSWQCGSCGHQWRST